MRRVLEPELMDTADEARDYDAMDHSAVNRVFVEDLLNVWDGGVPLLDVGTGTSQIPIELCRRAPVARVVGIDLAEHMLHIGRDNVRRAELTERIRLELVDAKAMPYPDGAFRGIISNSIVHHIPDPITVFREMRRVAAPGAVLFVRDLLRPGDEATVVRLVDTYAAGANEHQRAMFAASFRAALTLDEVRALAGEIGFGPETVRQTTDRHWTWIARA